MMKVLLLLGLLALVETRMVHSDIPFRSANARELEEEGKQLQEHVISELLRNLQNLDDKRELAAENNEADNLEDHSLEGNEKGEIRWIRNDSLLQSISDEESGEKGSQSQELGISKPLRNLQNLDDKRELAAENNEADNLEDHSLEGNMKGEIRWIRNDSPLQSISDEESVEKGSQSQELGISKLLRNLQDLDDKRELAVENNEADNLEDHSLEGNEKGETRWVRNDSPLESISDEESGEEGSQSQELVISKFLRSLEERLGNEENDWDESLKNYRSEKRANAHHVNDVSSGRREDIELMASLAQQANEIDTEKQRDLDQYKNRRLAVDVGKPVSNPSGNAGSHGFMEIPVDNQPMDKTIYRY